MGGFGWFWVIWTGLGWVWLLVGSFGWVLGDSGCFWLVGCFLTNGPSNHSSVCLPCKISELCHQFLLIFCMKLDSSHVRKVTKPHFCFKKNLSLPKWGFLGFGKNLIHSYVFLFLENEVTDGVLTFAKTTCLEEIWFLSYGLKTPRLIRMQDSLNYNVSKTSWAIKLNFDMWLDIHRSNKSTQLF